MRTTFETYKPRNIVPSEVIQKNEWSIKLYTITQKDRFSSRSILVNVIEKLPDWLKVVERSNLPIYKKAFLIVHEAREGVWILLNWWTGGEMIQTQIYFTDYKTPEIIRESPYNTSSLLCVWELEVFAHERRSWINNILKKANRPDFQSYLDDMKIEERPPL
ncbi:MAG: hypothetical protein AAFX53_17225 [Bacteroidota bacterium]